jgi:ribosomal protein S15P/S13E
MEKKSEESEKKEEKKVAKPKKITQAEFEKRVIELAKKDMTSEKIGEELRKQNIHSNDFSKTISQILKEKKTYINPDLKNVEEKLERIKTHFETNKQDKRAMREKDRVFAQLRKLKKYFKV